MSTSESFPTSLPRSRCRSAIRSRAESTPTLSSITGALNYAKQRQAATPSRRVALVYATDGIPQGCTTDGVNLAAMAAKNALVTATIPTYVLGVGPKLDSLNEIAAAGGTKKAFLVDTGGDVSHNSSPQHCTPSNQRPSRATTTSPCPQRGRSIPAQVNVIAQVGDIGDRDPHRSGQGQERRTLRRAARLTKVPRMRRTALALLLAVALAGCGARSPRSPSEA